MAAFSEGGGALGYKPRLILFMISHSSINAVGVTISKSLDMVILNFNQSYCR